MANSPVLKQGWLKKQSRSGLIKKWQTRYFVVHSGVIYYYQEKIEKFPFGEVLKGDLPLRGATIVVDPKKYGDRQLYIVAGNNKEDNNMLVEAESAALADEWRLALEQHAHFSDVFGAATGAPMPSFARSSTGDFDGINAAAARGVTSSVDNNGTDGTSGTLSALQRPSTAVADVGGAICSASEKSAPVYGTPRPGWVVKALREKTGEKIFVNVCEHDDVPFTPVPVGFNKWPHLVMAPGRMIQDGDHDVMVYDAVVNPQVIALSNKEATHKDAVCLRVLRLLKKNFRESVEPDYKLPKITKRYKGEPQSILLVPEGRSPSGKKSRFGFGASRKSEVVGVSPTPTSEGVHVEGSGPDMVDSGGSKDGKAAPGNFERRASNAMSNKPFSGDIDKNIDMGDRDSLVGHNQQPGLQRSLSVQGHATAASKMFPGIAEERRGSQTVTSSSGGSGGSGGSARNASITSNRMTNNNIDRDSQFARTNTFTPESSGQPNGTASGGKAYSRFSAVAKRVSLNPKAAAAVNASANGTGGDTRRRPSVGVAQAAAGGSERLSLTDTSRRFIPYCVVRSNGTIAKQRPDKASPGKVLKQGAKVMVIARRVMADGLAWLKTTEGWIVEKNYAGSVSRALTPQPNGQPIGAKVVTTRFEDASDSASAPGRESMVKGVSMKDDGSTRIMTDQSEYTMRPSTSGWTVFGASSKVASFQTRFVIDVLYPDNGVIRLARTYADVSGLFEALCSFPDRMIKDRALKAGEFPVVEDGSDEMMEDVNELLYVVEGVEGWLNKVLASITVDRCKCRALIDFLTPKDVDIYMMEKELMALGGLCGTHESSGDIQ